MKQHATARGIGPSVSRQSKAVRKTIGNQRAPEVVGKPEHAGLGKAHRPLPTERITVEDPKPARQVKSKDGEARCTFCGMRGHARRPIAAFLDKGAFVPACNICAKLRAQPIRLALPGPRMYGYWRGTRLALRKMIGNVKREIPTGPVIALGPGPKPTGYDPIAIEKTREQIKTELEKLTALRDSKRPGKVAWQGACNASWEVRSQEQRVQALQVRLHFLEQVA